MNSVFIILLTALIACSWMESRYGQSVLQDVSKRITEWLGEEPISKKRTVWGWLEVDVYSTKSGLALVDPNSGEIIMVSILKQLRPQKDVGIEKAFECALKWMEQRGINTHGWVLGEKHRYDRGNGFIEYMFTWFKYSPEGIQHPSFMKVLVSGEGEVSYWFRIDKPVSISLIPKISEKEALLKARSVLGDGFEPIGSPMLRVWFRGGKQQLWWEIVLRLKESKREWDAVVIVDAHTGELVDVYRPIGQDWIEVEKERYIRNALKMAKELKRCVKIEVFHKDIFDKPAAILRESDKRFQELLFAVRKLLRGDDWIVGGPPYLLLAEFQIRFYITPTIAYETKLSLRAAYFEVLHKAQLKRKGGKEIWERLEPVSVVVHKCPKEFLQEVTEVMKRIPGIPIIER